MISSKKNSYSIIIPVKKINNYVIENLKYILKIKNATFEVIIVTNSPQNNPWPKNKVKMIFSGKVGPGAKRDMAAKIAKYEILTFFDDDSFPIRNIFNIADTFFNNSNIIAIGGPSVTPKNNTFFQKISGASFCSKFSGAAPERYIPFGNSRTVDDWPSVNLMVRKKLFFKVGGFDTNFWPGEDTKFCLELGKIKNKKIFYCPKLIVFHHRRLNLKDHLKQISNYGLHRGYFVKIFPQNSFKLKYFLPSIVFLNICLLPALYFIDNFYLSIVGSSTLTLYFIIQLFAIFDLNSKIKNFKVSIFTLPLNILTHFFYGFNFLRGLLKKNLRSKLR